MRPAVNVSKEHHEDRSEPDDAGLVDWVYTYNSYTFCDSDMTLRFCQYADEPGVATFRYPINWSQLVGWRHLLGLAVEYLRAHEGIAAIHAYHPELGYYQPFEAAAHGAVTSGMISADDADRLLRSIRGTDAAI
jgi:hypothetical protein